MGKANLLLGAICAIAIGLAACSGEQSDWEKARASNNADTYEAFVKKYPNGSFTVQAQARLKEIYEERDWQKARDADTPDSYQNFLKQYPEGKWAEEARIRVENFNLAQAPGGVPAPVASAAAPAAPTQTVPPAPAANAPAPPASPPPAAAPKPVVKEKEKAKSVASGGYGVQLGAFSAGQKAADRHWAVLVKRYPSLLSGLTPKVRKGTSGKTHLYRLQVTGLKGSRASAICKALHAKHDSCAVLKPAHAKKKLRSHAK